MPGYDSQKCEGQDPWAASSMALGELVLDIFTDKSLCCGGKGQCWRSAGLALGPGRRERREPLSRADSFHPWQETITTVQAH